MKMASWSKKAFAISMIIVLVCSYFSFPASNVQAATTRAVLVGSLQSELSTETSQTGDWNPDTTVTEMTYLDNGTYMFTGTLPAGTYEYKVALNGKWDESYGYSSYTNPQGVDKDGNIALTLAAEAQVTFITTILPKKLPIPRTTPCTQRIGCLD